MKQKISFILALLLVFVCFAGCSGVRPAPLDTTQLTTREQTSMATETKPAETVPAAVSTTEEPPETVPTETEAAKTEPAETQPSETETPVTDPQPSPDPAGLSSELLEGLTINDAAIVIDGVLYKSEDPYSLLVNNGWDFNYEDYQDVDENYVLNKGQYIYSTIRLHNPEKYGTTYSNPDITIGLINLADGATKLKDCWIHGIKVSGVTGFRRYEDGTSNASPCYDFELPGGLRRGDSMETVLAQWGNPTDPNATYVADGDGYHYEILTYEGDHVTYKLTVYSTPDIGLQEVEISDTRNWTR